MSRPAAFNGNGGFTLIESLLSLTVFALILAIAYESVVSTASSRKLITERIDRQQSLRATHRTLSNAVYSNGPIIGQADSLAIDMNHADSPWLRGTHRVVFKVNDAGELIAYPDRTSDGIVLMNGLTRARFAYQNENKKQSSWQSPSRPKWIELSWLEKGNRKVWRFLAQI